MRTFVQTRWQVLALIAILGIAAISLSRTSALWSETETIEANVVQAGTISLALNALDGKPVNHVVSGDAIHGVGGILPGEATAWAKVELYNDGTRSQKQYMHLNNIAASHAGFCALHTIELARDTNGDLVPDEVIGEYAMGALNGPGNRVDVGRTFGEGPGVVPDNFTTVLLQRVKLSADASNSFNGTGATCTWDEVFTAEQVAP